MIITGFTSRSDLVSRLDTCKKTGENNPVKVVLPDKNGELEVYPASVRKFSGGGVFLAGNYNNHRNALFIFGGAGLRVMERYQGQVIYEHSDFVIKKCRITRSVASQLRSDFPFCTPTAPENGNVSMAFGDVLGVAARAQMMVFSDKCDLTFSRQCLPQIRKMELHPEDALDAITWAVFQEGYKNGYAAEGCQLTEKKDVEDMIDAGFTRLSFEPDHTGLFQFREMSKRELLDQMFEVDWIRLRDKFELMANRYMGCRIEIGSVESSQQSDALSDPLVIIPTEHDVLSAIRIFGDTISRIVEMEKVLTDNACREKVILEISFSRSGKSLTPFEHYFVMNELMRRDILPDYLAPGRITREHVQIAQHLGKYGLSGPAGYFEEGDFMDIPFKQHWIYPDISYTTAVKVIAEEKPGLFRKIWERARSGFEEARQETGSKLTIQNIPSVTEIPDEALPDLSERAFTEDFLTMTMGAVMTHRDQHGNRKLRQELYDFVIEHEPAYMKALLATYSKWAKSWDRNFSGTSD